ncbi:hypothetical protein SAMN05660226_01698 [Parapedobacter luteus]|uniref:Uncharacterized protein n=1 Tax=Parapedobacter luteus TaxID=623280 RepID=A0A1T5BSR7_9SPHI|nr:hypothetical protein SAMN05660226_01698 [Parapedobacter luteus]
MIKGAGRQPIRQYEEIMRQKGEPNPVIIQLFCSMAGVFGEGSTIKQIQL